MSDGYVYITPLHDGLCWVGEGTGRRAWNHELRVAEPHIIFTDLGKEDRRSIEKAIQVAADVVEPRWPSVRRYEDPVIQAFIRLIGQSDSTETWKSIHDVVPNAHSLTYSIESFWYTWQERENPETRDPLISILRLTNPRRVDDRVSRVMRLTQLDHADDDPRIRLFNALMHRKLSHLDTIETYGWPRRRSEAHIAVEQLWANGRPPTPPWGAHGGSKAKPTWSEREFHDCVDAWIMDDLLDAIRLATTIEDIHTFLNKRQWPTFKNGRGFTLFEVCADLPWWFEHLGADDWAHFRVRGEVKDSADSQRGSGSALLMMFGEDPRGRYGDDEHKINLARKVQSECPFRSTPTLLDIEHWLCEFSKIMRVYRGVTRGPRRYEKNPVSLPSAVSDDEVRISL